MRNREKQREYKRTGKRKSHEKPISYHNHERYADPTAYFAVMSIAAKERGIASTR